MIRPQDAGPWTYRRWFLCVVSTAVLFVITFTPSIAISLDQVGVKNENDPARIVLMHEPGTELLPGLLHPRAALFKFPFTIEGAIQEHRKYRQLLESMGIKTRLVTELLLEGTLDNEGHAVPGEKLESLRQFASLFLTYDLSELPYDFEILRREASKLRRGPLKQDMEEQLAAIRGELNNASQDSYKKNKVLDHLGPKELVNIILQRPVVKLNLQRMRNGKKVYIDLIGHYVFRPVMNLYFLRDQQITTSKGVVLGRMKLQQRQAETEIMRYALMKAGIRVIYEVKEPGALEGGDYIPAGDIVFQGQGMRTNEEAIRQLLENDVYGAKDVVVVKDIKDQNMDRMHLDTIFNIVDSQTVLLLESVKDVKDKQRSVDVYRRQEARGSLTSVGPYVKVDTDIEFGAFLAKRGFKIITVTDDEQSDFAVNILNIGKRTIITPHDGSRLKDQLSSLGIQVKVIDFTNMKGGWGAAHCTTQVISREP